MAQWQELLRLDPALQARVSQLYERKFPRVIRHCLCVLIESQDWDLAAVDENKANTCFHALLVFLQEQWKQSVQENNILQGPDFPGMQDYLLKHFKDEPLNLAKILSECLKEEKKILASASEAQGCSSSAMGQKWRELDNKVNEVKRQTLEVKKEIKSLDVLNEKLDFIQTTWQSQVQQHIGLADSYAVVKEECVKRGNFITQTKQMVVQQIRNILILAEQIVAILTDVELPEWKRRQQMACIGSPVDICLDHLQKWFTIVAEVLLRVREQLQMLQDQNKKYSSDASNLPGPLAEIEKLAWSLLTKLLANALVVEKQPVMSSLPQRPLILKTGVRFTVTLRFLANLPEFKCLLKVKPVFDKDVEEVMTVNGLRHFDFNRDDCKVLDMDTPGEGLVAEFGHMSLKERKARAKGPCESRLGVTEELHIIKFVTGLQYAGLQCNIEASSLPVVVISSTNQIVSAWASVMWCNMLSTSEPRNLLLFVDPPPLTWQQLSPVLSWQFLSVGQRELDENQLSVLREKIADDPDGLVHWSTFSKSNSAWIWIDGILDLIKRHLVDLWRDGSIMGFVNRNRTRVLLQEKQAGTFLLRFSESNKDGAITISWVEHSNGETHVHAVEPYTKQELSAISLPDIIYRYSVRAQRNMTRNPLLYLYPDIPKHTAFGRYYNSSETSEPKKVVDGSPTPPPSPPREIDMMDMDIDMNIETLFQEVFSELLDLPGLPDIHTSYQEMASTQTLSRF
ncbi:signal transducer and activator of transcription 1-alpha/beta-like isoform X2 [Siniperca chuatsi]|uniref:signal transducer and activator of transcription 1-alpha/beta-like isoform X2 n=1 Tax=Siniperca chuatsi TaxID=119488 RepID=UPI001CE1AC4D|nr:signal transducer and activator of transcription 1-alpha/beta-like isoform X2 [Siniperca chuatsi]